MEHHSKLPEYRREASRQNFPILDERENEKLIFPLPFFSFCLKMNPSSTHWVHKYIIFFSCVHRNEYPALPFLSGERELLNELFTSVHSPEKTNEYRKQLVSSYFSFIIFWMWNIICSRAVILCVRRIFFFQNHFLLSVVINENNV